MTTRRSPRATRAPARSAGEAPVIPEDASMIKARRLPMFGPGIVITVPWSLYTEYMELYGLEPQGMRPDGVLTVKRVPKETK